MGKLLGVRPAENSVIAPLGVIRPIVRVAGLGEPEVAVRARGDRGGQAVGVRPAENSVIAPLGVIRPIRPGLPDSVNQRLPSGPR